MTALDIPRRRLFNQRIDPEKCNRPGDAVAWLGAMQAQDYANVKWAVGLRTIGATDASIEEAFKSKAILRTWLLRGTLHLVAPEDVRWMLALLAPRLIVNGARRNRELELDETTYASSFKVLTNALQGGRQTARNELMSALEQACISTKGQRGYHILARAALEGLICFGPQQGKEQAFVLLDEWAPKGRRLEGEEALAELARRYFASHGPASLPDFTWWSGLTAREARTGLELVKTELQQESIKGQSFWLQATEAITQGPSPCAYLVPGYDEYYLGYTDRSFLLKASYAKRAVSSNGVFRPVIVMDGQVVGTWKREIKQGVVLIKPQPFETLTETESHALEAATIPYGIFHGLPAELA